MAKKLVFIPIYYTYWARKKNEQGRAAGARKRINQLYFLKALKATAEFLNITPAFDVDKPGEEFAKWQKAQKSLASIVQKYKDYKMISFSSLDDTKGADDEIAINGKTSTKRAKLKVPRGITARFKVERPFQTTSTDPQENNKQSFRTVGFTFPSTWRRIMILQAVWSLCQFKPDKVSSIVRIDGTPYDLVPGDQSAMLPNATQGAWLQKSIPTGLSDDDPDIQEDNPPSVQTLAT